MKATTKSMQGPAKRSAQWRNYFARHWTLYTMLLPGIALLLIFNYIPMYGIVMAFQRFKPSQGFLGSIWAQPWYRYLAQVVQDAYFARVFRNTLLLGLYAFIFGFPAPILLALLFNELKGTIFKRAMQTISYMPYFVSTVVVVGIMKLLFATNGPVSEMVKILGGGGWINPFQLPSAFRTLYVVSGIWMGVGYNSIIYLAAISNISPDLYEAAVIDGASRFQQCLHVTLPSLMPTITILLIFTFSSVIYSDTPKVLLMYNEATYETADIIGTYTYRIGIQGTSYSYAAAASLFTTVIALVLLTTSNYVSKKVSDTSLW